ncbi:MAG: N-acetylmuramoyl-L-alanine amidase [Lachnospiraceae bacterium]|nr:N-acetylmuramoyl-L-alanine amidase [Lachnospiraceae bacterium]
MILISALLLSGCSMPWQDDEEKKETETAEETPAIIEEEPEKETPVIVVKSSGNFAEDVTEEEKERLEEGAQDGDGTEAETTQEPPEATNIDKLACEPGQAVSLDPNWEYASFSKIHDGSAVYYAATENRCGLVVGVNAGHGTKGGTSVKTYCHPDMTPKVTGGTTAAGSVEAVAVSGGMTFTTGESEASVNLRLARFLRDALLEMGYDVLMIRDGDDVQLDNVARTVICNNVADCHVAIHFDGDSQSSDKGCFFMSVPDGIKSMPPVDRTWHMSEELGTQIIMALGANGHKICGNGSMAIDLTQTSYSTIPSVDVEFGNQCSDTSDENLRSMALATAAGIDSFFDVSN